MARRFEERGAERIDGDALGWEILRDPGVRDAIEREFGPGIVAHEAVDRVRLGTIVFADEAAMARLNAIVQPPLLALVRARMDAPAPDGRGIRVLDAALLSSWSLEGELDGVVLVTAPEYSRIARLRKARGYDDGEASRRIRGQRLPPLGTARRRWNIENDGDTAALIRRADAVWEELRALAAATRP